MVYGIPSHVLVTKQQSFFIVRIDFRCTFLTSLLNDLLEYLDSLLGSETE